MTYSVEQLLKDAVAKFQQVWPKGSDCEHTHAREGFRLLDMAIANTEQRREALQHVSTMSLRMMN
ncbi:MAG: hypothetical protein ABFE08_05415, partial [Armatimonadia bacterium]